MVENIILLVIHSLIILSYIIFIFKKDKIVKKFKMKEDKKLFKGITNCLKIRFKIFPILFSIVIIFFIDVLIIFLSKIYWKMQYDGVFDFILSVIIVPISEEILFRGILFGVIFLVMIPAILSRLKINFNGISKFVYSIISLFLVSLFFAFSHNNPGKINFIVRLSQGLIYGGLYLLYDKNLVPPIIAHMTHNILINTGYFNLKW